MIRRLVTRQRLIQFDSDILYQCSLVGDDRVKVRRPKGCYGLFTMAEFEQLIGGHLTWLQYSKALARGKRERRDAARR